MDEKLQNPHDRFFRRALSRPEAASDFLRYYLPADVVQWLDLSSLEISKESFIDPNLQTHFSDLLYTVALRDDTERAGQTHVYVLFEHKSYPDSHVAFQLLRYMMRIWERTPRRQKTLTPIIPIVIYHGAVQWRSAPNFARLFDAPPSFAPYLPDYAYQLCELSQYSDDEIKGAVSLRIALLLLKYIFSDELRHRVVDILRLYHELGDRRTGLEYLESMLRYLSEGTERVTADELQEAMNEVFTEEDAVPTPADTWREQGREEGLKLGIERGIEQGLEQGQILGLRQGQLDAIALGLELKFGADGLRLLPEISKIEDLDMLRAIREGLKVTSSLDELRSIYQIQDRNS